MDLEMGPYKSPQLLVGYKEFNDAATTQGLVAIACT